MMYMQGPVRGGGLVRLLVTGGPPLKLALASNFRATLGDMASSVVSVEDGNELLASWSARI